jgi:hypothetical protein
VTKNDTQGTLDSKHLQKNRHEIDATRFNVERQLAYEISIFSTQSQVFELATRRQYATIYVRGYDDANVLLSRLRPGACVLEKGGPYNKGKDWKGNWRYLNQFRFIVVPNRPRGHFKVVYESARELDFLLRHLELDKIVAFSDVRHVFQTCGVVCHFFNMVEIVGMELFGATADDGESSHERDVLTIVKYQCRSGRPLALNRDGLAKNQERSPLEVLSFEAPKKNFVRLSTEANENNDTYRVEKSADKIFFGQQFNEGTGYDFAILPKL